MSSAFVFVTAALAADSLAASLLNTTGQWYYERRGRTYSVLALDGNIHRRVLVNHRGKVLDGLEVRKSTSTDPMRLHQRALAENNSEKRSDILLLQMMDHPDYVCDPRLGYTQTPTFENGNFVIEGRPYEQPPTFPSILQRCMAHVTQLK